MSTRNIPENVKKPLSETVVKLNLMLEELHGNEEANKLRIELLKFAVAVDLFDIEPLDPNAKKV